MAPTSTAVTKEERRRVANTYGHPWPWQVRELVEAHTVEHDVDIRDLAKRWAFSEKKLGRWIRNTVSGLKTTKSFGEMVFTGVVVRDGSGGFIVGYG